MTRKSRQSEIERIFKEHYREFCLLSYCYVSCMDQAQDIVQDVFLAILTRKDTSEMLNFKGYIWISVKNASIKSLERSIKMKPILKDVLALPYLEETEIENRQLGQKLQQALDKLPHQCKNVFELCVIDGQKYDYAANHLGISKNTVKTHVKKAYKVLRDSLIVL
ncbi:RNA polymerase sigma factor [Arenibacter sp. ARW7G5Y1]|uniref:RNA polymerase sigma factor n=1 Tax=Arenibacter sp. ARW7G5Y1 TaxID=2135619 RepID=UPI000D7600BF|nr:sigma-70 family RNA polymerase sigma factor [Arenibacter sp. ARW7G5Y1]PXX23720.1 RNA polymerase sigma-70 factor (ECF subfamily) [Arenibacter sp. ARW7G5Y1]